MPEAPVDDDLAHLEACAACYERVWDDWTSGAAGLMFRFLSQTPGEMRSRRAVAANWMTEYHANGHVDA